MSATLQAYPVPSQSNFTWMKCFSNDCEDLKTNAAVNITTIELTTRLTIFDVTEADFGMYELIVTNGIGEQMVQKFYLLPQGKIIATK